jgi:hypothetical protein
VKQLAKDLVSSRATACSKSVKAWMTSVSVAKEIRHLYYGKQVLPTVTANP